LISAGVPLARVRGMACVPEVLRVKSAFSNTEKEKMAKLDRRVQDELEALAKEFSKPAA